jgi:hypothetical protein
MLSYKNRIVGNFGYNSYADIINGHSRAYGEGNKKLEQINLTIQKLKYVQRELNKRDKKFLCISAYSYWEIHGDKVSRYYRYFGGYHRGEVNQMMETYNDLLKMNKINYFDSHTFLENNIQLRGIETASYYDKHWNRYGAGLVMIESLKYLKTKYKTNWDIPQVKSVEVSTTPVYEDIALIGGANLFDSLKNSFMRKRLSFPYIVYEIPKKEELTKIVIIGDSFTRSFEDQLIKSKFTNKKNIASYSNKDTRGNTELFDNIKKVIEGNDIIIIIYVESSFYSSRFKTIVDTFYSYLKTNEKSSKQ